MFARIKKQLRAVIPQGKGRGTGAHPMFQPEHDWQIMSAAFIVVNVVVAVIAWYMYIQVESGTFFASTVVQEENSSAQLQKNELTNIIEHYEQKKRRSGEFQREAEVIIDPSE
ncbi:MAG: hypothetical protein WDZ82_03165 [Candidatus Paceibacterota bacterium]